MTKAISEYVAHEYTGTGEFHAGLSDLRLPMLTAPPPPDPTDLLQMELWKLEVKDHHKNWSTMRGVWSGSLH